eukprot:scaffold3505_cov170-Amphora_coffeaeformis.AAC.6
MSSPGTPRDFVIRQNYSDEPSALASMGSSFLEPIIEGDENSKESSMRKKSQQNWPPAMNINLPGGSMVSQDTENGLEERDYDRNPTQLYILLQARSWEEAINRVDKFPHEAKVWIFRKESDGRGLRWRLLPLHASIIFKAPVEVVESIITVFSEAAKECDDQNSLPIHLAYKRGASASTYRILLESFPGCLDVKDAKGRTPRDLARKGSGPRHVEFVYALKIHATTRELAREEARAEEEQKFKVKLEGEQKAYTEKLEKVREANRIEIEKMEKKIKNLEEDVEVSQSITKSLNENISELQSQLRHHQEAESSLARQLAEKNAEIEESKRKASPEQERMQEELKRLAVQITDLKQQVNKLLLEKEILNKSLESVVESTEWEKRKLEKKIEEQRRTIEALKQAARKSEAEKEKLRAELREKEDKERDLSETIENLETQLKCRKLSTDEAAEAVRKCQINLKGEVDVLKDSNNRMSNQLKSVATFLGEMKEEQVAIVHQAAEHEKQMEVFVMEHARILEELEEQNKRDSDAQKSRELIAALLKVQEEEMARNLKAREKIQHAISLQSARIEDAASGRQALVKSTEKIGHHLEANLNSVLATVPHASADEESIQDVTPTSHASHCWSKASTRGVSDSENEIPTIKVEQ